MPAYEPIRDQFKQIVGMRRRRAQEAESQFGTLLRETMTAVGANSAPAAPAPPQAPEEQEPPRVRFGHLELAGLVCGLVLALALIALVNRIAPPAPSDRMAVSPVPTAPAVTWAPPTATIPSSPTSGAVMIVAWAAPDGLVLGPIPMPLTATARFDDDWVGVAWQNGMVWVRRADWPSAPIATLPNLAPPTPAPTLSARSVVAPIERELAPSAPAVYQPSLEPTPLPCWAGPPAPIQPGQIQCWRGVPFVVPAQP
jgi:hypothetical protein